MSRILSAALLLLSEVVVWDGDLRVATDFGYHCQPLTGTFRDSKWSETTTAICQGYLWHRSITNCMWP